jgi:hypothetical protein
MASAGNLEDAALSGRPYISTPNVYPARLRAVPLKDLFIAEGDQGVDAGGAAGWDPAGGDSGVEEERGYGG